MPKLLQGTTDQPYDILPGDDVQHASRFAKCRKIHLLFPKKLLEAGTHGHMLNSTATPSTTPGHITTLKFQTPCGEKRANTSIDPQPQLQGVGSTVHSSAQRWHLANCKNAREIFQE